MKKITTEEFIKRAKEIHGDKYDYSKVEYINAHTKVCIICPEHGEFWQKPSNHISLKQGCPICKNTTLKINKLLTTEEFIKRAKEIHGDKYNYSKVEYVDTSTKVCIICPEHGEFWQTPNGHLNGQGCPYCKIRSILEQKTINYLNKTDIKYEKEKTFDWLKYNGNLRLDFYLPEYNIAIECQGKQHFIYDSMFYKSYDDFICQLERDKTKFELCKKHNINIIYFKNKNTENKNSFYEDKTLITQIEKIKDLL